MSKEYIVIISEGEVTEKQIIENIQKNFFHKPKPSKEILFLSFKTNIYALWKVLEQDEFDTYIVDVLIERDPKIANFMKDIDKKKISEVYLFFDYDGHAYQNKKKIGDEIVEKMLQTFDNETEQGKLYISYPMAEALKDLKREDSCYRRCSVPAKLNIHYKHLVSLDTQFKDLTRLKERDWRLMINHCLKKSSCLILSRCEAPDYHDYLKYINQNEIFKKQLEKNIKVNQTVVVISAFPLFLIDYFGERFYYLQRYNTAAERILL